MLGSALLPTSLIWLSNALLSRSFVGWREMSSVCSRSASGSQERENKTYRTSNFYLQSRHVNEGLVEVLDSLSRLLGGLEANIAYPPVGYQFCICDGISFGEVRMELLVRQVDREITHKDT